MVLVTLYPNRELRVVLSRPRPPRPEPKGGDKRYKLPPLEAGEGGVGGAFLDIPPQPSQPIPRREFNRRPLSKKAKHKILHLAAIAAQSPRDRQVFLTGTLPGSTWEAMKAFSAQASASIKRLQTYLPRELGVSARELEYVWVWEFQKRGALHLHMCLVCPDSSVADEAVAIWPSVWGKVLRAADRAVSADIFAREGGGSHRDNPSVWQCDAQRVNKDVGRYLAKYLGKSSSGFHGFSPPRWWGVSSKLRRQLSAWVGTNTSTTPSCIKANAITSEVKGSLESALRSLCVGRVTDMSPKFSDSAIQVFGYAKDGLTVDNCAQVLEILLSDYMESYQAVSRPQSVPQSQRLPSLLRIIWSYLRPWERDELLRMSGYVRTGRNYGAGKWMESHLDDVVMSFGYMLNFGGPSRQRSPVWLERAKQDLAELKAIAREANRRPLREKGS